MMPFIFRATAILVSAFLFLCQADTIHAFSLSSPEKKGIALSAGSSYDPEPTFGFLQLSISALYDYESIWGHKAPEALKFKLEGNVGGADWSGIRMLASFNFYALYYLRALETPTIRPYIEGGVGIVYSDFQVEGQGLRVNFNPQAGIGCEWQMNHKSVLFGALHAYHISNGGLDDDNRGINGVLFQVGSYF